LYCINFGCAATAGGAGLITGGMAYDAVLVAVGRDKQILPLMGKAYTRVFGEVLNNQTTQTDQTQTKTQTSTSTPRPTTTETQNQPEGLSVTEMVREYHKMTPSEILEFMIDINSSYNKSI
jgi:hypothetical protein